MTKTRKPWEKPQSKNQFGSRKQNTRQPREVILIVCEGEATEPNYFEGFP